MLIGQVTTPQILNLRAMAGVELRWIRASGQPKAQVAALGAAWQRYCHEPYKPEDLMRETSPNPVCLRCSWCGHGLQQAAWPCFVMTYDKTAGRYLHP